jgi:hypothetical protein
MQAQQDGATSGRSASVRAGHGAGSVVVIDPNLSASVIHRCVLLAVMPAAIIVALAVVRGASHIGRVVRYACVKELG